MIRDIEIRDRARRLGVDIDAVRSDYVLNHLLVAVARATDALVFRGGTALARAYWPDFRLSEDLDFISTASGADIASAIDSAVAMAAERTGIRLVWEPPAFHDGWTRCRVRWDGWYVEVDVNRGETPKLPAVALNLQLPYSDLAEDDHTIQVVVLEEILANKWYMLDDRSEPRDLYDIWYGICVRGVPLHSVADVFQAKYTGRARLWRIERSRKLETAWEQRLSHQVRDLPPFPQVFDEVAARVREWEDTPRGPGGQGGGR